MRKNKKKILIKSKFNRNEKFSVSNVPKHFESVTDAYLKHIQKKIFDKVGNNMKFTPGALEMALKSVDGEFEDAYSTLEGDYSARLTNLDSAYSGGIAKLRNIFKQYQLQVSEHNQLYARYSDANKAFNGKSLPESLAISDEEIRSIKTAIKELERRNHG